MKVTIIYDNTSLNKNLQADWGFSAYIELYERNILFDTGGNGKILLNNMLALDINPKDIDDIVISHPDFDHIGGLSAILNENSKAVIHNPISFRGVHYENNVKYYGSPLRIYDNVYLTGELGKQEQALALKTKNGLALIVGCSHPGVKSFIDSVAEFGNVSALIGGLHDFNQYDELKGIDLICPTHCTKHIKNIKELYPDNYIPGGAGTVITF